MAARIYIALVAFCWTALLCGLAFFDSAGGQPVSLRSLWWIPLLSAPLWVSLWAVGRTSLVGRSVRWVCVMSLGGLLYFLSPLLGPWKLEFWLVELLLLVILSVLLILVVPEIRKLTSRGATTRAAKDVAVAGVIVTVGLGAYGLYWLWANSENTKLGAIVTNELEKIDLPPGSIFIYEEVQANRICKTAGIRRVFATEMKPGELCPLISAQLQSRGWQILNACQLLTYPLTPRSRFETRPSYDVARLVARMPSKGVLELRAEPKDSWDSRFMLSSHGESKAIPLAKKAGSAFFTIKLSHFADMAYYDRICPDDGGRCECADSTLFAWKFADGRRLRISD